ncbi:hypothetical protein ACFPRL_31160 [Pseudoclavibacter helvolus]
MGRPARGECFTFSAPRWLVTQAPSGTMSRANPLLVDSSSQPASRQKAAKSSAP